VKQFIILSILWFCCGQILAQNSTEEKKDSLPSSENKKDSLSGFDKFNKKAENLFKILPVPIYSYSPEAGNIFGLAKFNVLSLSKERYDIKAFQIIRGFYCLNPGKD
jgi:hypothetical protein